VNTSPVSPDDIRAAAAAHQELGPEYSDAVVAAFLERVDRAVAARVEARLASTRQTSMRRANRRTMLTGLAIGAAGGALATGLAVASLDGGSTVPAQGQIPNVQLLPVYLPANGHGLPANGPGSLVPPPGRHRLGGG
jgi:hypothetical protein